MFEINQFAIFWGMKRAVRLMTLGGSIILVSDEAAYVTGGMPA